MTKPAIQPIDIDSRRLKELFCDALETPPAERNAWVRSRCRSLTPASRQSLISLLQAHADAGDFLRDPNVRLGLQTAPGLDR